MRQLNIFCEGQTEQGFCNQVLLPHLFPNGSGILHTLAVGLKNHHHVYGLGRRASYKTIDKFIQNTIKQRAGKDVYFTTFFDLYALPHDFPGTAENSRNPSNPTPYVVALEKAFGEAIDRYHFIPYLQLHEYETLLFSDPEAFSISFNDCGEKIEQLKVIAASVSAIELLNDGRETAPSKRIIEVIPEYNGRKATAGPDIAEFIGLPKLRKCCPHFDKWVTQLERIPWVVDD